MLQYDTKNDTLRDYAYLRGRPPGLTCFSRGADSTPYQEGHIWLEKNSLSTNLGHCLGHCQVIGEQKLNEMIKSKSNPHSKARYIYRDAFWGEPFIWCMYY